MSETIGGKGLREPLSETVEGKSNVVRNSCLLITVSNSALHIRSQGCFKARQEYKTYLKQKRIVIIRRNKIREKEVGTLSRRGRWGGGEKSPLGRP